MSSEIPRPQSTTLFTVAGMEVDTPLLCSLIAILALGLLQISWPSIVAYLRRKPTTAQVSEMPIIETVSEDVKPSPKRRRFVKDSADIANWAETAPLSSTGSESTAARDDPNTILPAGLDSIDAEAAGRTDADGRILDLDGSVIEAGTCMRLPLVMLRKNGDRRWLMHG